MARTPRNWYSTGAGVYSLHVLAAQLRDLIAQSVTSVFLAWHFLKVGLRSSCCSVVIWFLHILVYVCLYLTTYQVNVGAVSLLQPSPSRVRKLDVMLQRSGIKLVPSSGSARPGDLHNLSNK